MSALCVLFFASMHACIYSCTRTSVISHLVCPCPCAFSTTNYCISSFNPQIDCVFVICVYIWLNVDTEHKPYIYTLYATPKDILYLMNAAHGRILSYRSIAPQIYIAIIRCTQTPNRAHTFYTLKWFSAAAMMAL